MDDDDALGIPEFLRRSRTGWTAPPAPPRLDPVPPPLVFTEPVRLPDADPAVTQRKKNKSMSRLTRMKFNQEMENIPPAFREWDTRRSRWVDSRVAQHQRLKAAADRLGITLEPTEMDKLTIVPYLKDQVLPAERGRTTVPATAADFEIQAKVVKAANRANLKKLDRVEVINQNGEIRETWSLDLESKMLHKVGTELKVPTSVAEEPTTMPRAAKKTGAKKAKAKTNGNGAGKPGIIDVIIETIKRDRGASREEIVGVLAKRFPDRKPALSTINIQANKNAKKKEDDPKRGRVYYG